MNQWIVQDTLSWDQPGCHNTFVSHVFGPKNVHVGIVENSTFQIMSEFECLYYVCGLAVKIFKFIDYTTTFCLIQQHFLIKDLKVPNGFISKCLQKRYCVVILSPNFSRCLQCPTRTIRYNWAVTSLPCWLWPEFYWGTMGNPLYRGDFQWFSWRCL